MKLHELLKHTTDYVMVKMQKGGYTKATLTGYATDIFKYGNIPNIDIIDISASDGTLTIECDIDSIKGAYDDIKA